MDTYRKTVPGPVTIVAAAVVVVGDRIIVQAQDADPSAGSEILRVEYEYSGLPAVELTSAYLGPGAGGPRPVPVLPAPARILLVLALAVGGALASPAVRRGRGVRIG